MDMNKLLKNINTLNEYISTSRDILEENKNAKVQFNMSTVLALKKIRSYEVEYFNKYEENGIACAALQIMVNLTPSKTWGVLGKEIINLIQYWLDAIRKHLISHNSQWWTFTALLLQIMKEVRQKDSSIPNLLVEQTAECLLDLATNNRADAFQKYEILHCLNMYCAESNREIRFAMRNKLGEYFTKLSAYISSCGHFPSQLSVMETLLRWLLPRQDQILRMSSADKWFPKALYGKEAINIFLERPWMDFFQDARDFLNVHNKSNDFVRSFICRCLCIGDAVVIPGKAKHVSWVDMNVRSRCLSVVLDPQMLETFGATYHKSWETLVITEDNTQAAKLDKPSNQLTISVTTFRPAQAHPSSINIGDEGSKDVKMVVSSKSDLTELDKALSEIFGDKYQLQLNLDSEATESTQNTRNDNSNSEEENRFSHPAVVRRNRRSGYVVRSRNPWKSPSTASTTSLAQLHDKLAALPTYKFDKELVSVCANPDLSSITEASETDDRRSFHSASTLKFLRPYGVCYRGARKAENASPKRDESKKSNRGLSPAVGKAAPSCLLVATIGSTDESVINNTMERLAKNDNFEPDNIVDLLVKEALEAPLEDQLDSGINTGENRKTDQEENCDAIENTPNADLVNRGVVDNAGFADIDNITRKRGRTVRESTSDESNTEVISGTPLNYVTKRKNIRKKSYEECSKEVPSHVYDAQAVEEFFSQHFAQEPVPEIVMSPTLARKMNESSSETSEHFDEFVVVEIHETPKPNVDKSEVIECLNYIVDKVCNDFDKYTDRFNMNKEMCNFINDIQEPLQTVMDVQDNGRKHKTLMSPKSVPEVTKRANIKTITSPITQKTRKRTTITKKLKNTAKKDESATVEQLRSKNDEVIVETNKRTQSIANKKSKTYNCDDEITVLDSTIIEENIQKENVSNNIEEQTGITTDIINDLVLEGDASLVRRKRKLYSPKEEKNYNDRVPLQNSEDDDIILMKTPSKVTARKSSTTFYQDIEKERKKYTRKPRLRKSKVPEPVSPRTSKRDQMFDKLKETVESNETITLVDKTFEVDVYNFSSDSEEEYFKKKKIVPRKRPSNTTIASFESGMSTRRGRVTKKVNYTENKSSNDESNNQVVKRKRIVRKQKTNKRKISIERPNSLEDERMRQAPPEVLNTSIVCDNYKEMECAELEPVLTSAPQLETIEVEQSTNEAKEKKKSVKRHKKKELSLKRGNNSTQNSIIATRDESIGSPLPGLVVESAPTDVDDNNDSVTGTMLQKLKKFYRGDVDAFVNETNTTHNLLSDVEILNYSSQGRHAIEAQQDVTEIDNSIDESEVVPKKQVARTKKLKAKAIAKHSSANGVSYNKSDNMVSDKNASETMNKSDISITSQGIDGHGDIDEAPPSLATIERNVQARNLDLEYLDDSIKDLFINLQNQIYGNDDKTHDDLSSSENIDRQSNGHKDVTKNKTKAAKVVVAKLSTKEIDKWLSPSKSDSVKTSRKKRNPSKNKPPSNGKENTREISESRVLNEIQNPNSLFNHFDVQNNNEEQNKSKGSKDLQSLYEAHKWFPSRRNSSSDVESEQNKSEGKKSVLRLVFKTKEPLANLSISSTYEIRSKKSNKEESSRKDGSLKLLYNNIASLRNRRSENGDLNDNKSETKCNTLDESQSSIQADKSEAIKLQKRSSVISPIKMDNFISQTQTNTQPDDDAYVKRVRNIFSEGDKNSKKKKVEPKLSRNHLEVLSSPNSTSTKINSSVEIKRKWVPLAVESKKQKKDVLSPVDTESGPSTSSVNEWFARNEPKCSTDDVALLSIIDCVHNVMEKLDTTLVDINQNSSNLLIRLFVDAEKQLNERREQRRNSYKQAASDMLSQILKMVDEKFCDLDKRSQEMDDSFMEKLRSRASQVILEDSKQKQAMVQIMKEDVQAVIDNMKKEQ